MRRLIAPRSASLAVVVLLGLTAAGCYAVRTGAPSAVEPRNTIRLRADSGLLVWSAAGAQMGRTCHLLSVTGVLRRVSGDTFMLAYPHAVQRAPRQGSCELADSIRVVSVHPERLQVARVRISLVRTILLLAGAPAVVVLIYLHG